MQIVLHGVDGSDPVINCPACSWKGAPEQLKKGEYMELSNITEIFCPACDKYLGFIQYEAGDDIPPMN